jgi:acetoin utilization protein AcuB
MQPAAFMLLKQIMKRDPITVNDTDLLCDAHRKMIAARSRHLPVVHDGKLVGILSERDIFEFRAHHDVEGNWLHAKTSAAMRTPPQTAGPNDSLTEAAVRMAASKIGALPIVEIGKLIGIVTVTDVLAAEVEEAMR